MPSTPESKLIYINNQVIPRKAFICILAYFYEVQLDQMDRFQISLKYHINTFLICAQHCSSLNFVIFASDIFSHLRLDYLYNLLVADTQTNKQQKKKTEFRMSEVQE